MSTNIQKAPEHLVPRGRGTNPLDGPVIEIAEKLEKSPGEWFLIGQGDRKKRTRLSNAAALLSSGRYKQLREFYERGTFEARVSGAKHAPHADEYEVGVFARFLPNG